MRNFGADRWHSRVADADCLEQGNVCWAQMKKAPEGASQISNLMLHSMQDRIEKLA